MLGTCTIEIQLAPASILMLGTTISNADVPFGTPGNTPSKTEVGRAALTANTGQRTIALAAETADYTLTNLEFRCVRYGP
jgi:hypothetical protein